MSYRQPVKLAEWKNDIPNGELYFVIIYDNRTVISSCGRYSHSSGSQQVSWDGFLKGDMNDLVKQTMGLNVFNDVLSILRRLNIEDT